VTSVILAVALDIVSIRAIVAMRSGRQYLIGYSVHVITMDREQKKPGCLCHFGSTTITRQRLYEVNSNFGELAVGKKAPS